MRRCVPHDVMEHPPRWDVRFWPAVTMHVRENVGEVYTAAVVHVRRAGRVVCETAAGFLNPEIGPLEATCNSVFDLASLTKVMVATAFLTCVAQGEVDLRAPVHTVLPDFRGPRRIQPYEDPLRPGHYIWVSPDVGPADPGRLTFWHLLTHTSGLPAWMPLYREPPAERRARVMGTAFAYPPGTRVVYSDLGFMLLGWALEALTGRPLPVVLEERVWRPLGLRSVHYRPNPTMPGVANIAATERCAWRRRRLWGEVHDENAWALGGVSGHAGLFATAADVAALGQAWLDALNGRGPLAWLGPLAHDAVRVQAEDDGVRCGLGWALWSPAAVSPSHPFSPRTFGHTGFTGTSLYVDPERELVVVALTNRVYYGRRPEAILRWRLRLHETIVT